MDAITPKLATPTIAALVREALRDHDGIIADATEAVVSQLANDAALLRAVIESAVRDAVGMRAQKAIRDERAAIIRRVDQQEAERATAPEKPASKVEPRPLFDGKAAVRAIAKSVEDSLLDMPLAGGIRLRNCDGPFVYREATRFDGLSKECGRKARFLTHIAQSVPSGKVVGEVIDDVRANELWKEAA